MCRGRAPDERTQKKKKKSSKDNPRVQAWMTTVSQFIFFFSKTDLVYRHELLCRSGNGHGGSILTPQAENKNYQSVGTCSTWKMQSWLENTSVAFAMCIVQQSRSRYRLYVVRGRLHSNRPLDTGINLRNQRYEEWGIRTIIYRNMIIERIKSTHTRCERFRITTGA